MNVITSQNLINTISSRLSRFYWRFWEYVVQRTWILNGIINWCISSQFPERFQPSVSLPPSPNVFCPRSADNSWWNRIISLKWMAFYCLAEGWSRSVCPLYPAGHNKKSPLASPNWGRNGCDSLVGLKRSTSSVLIASQTEYGFASGFILSKKGRERTVSDLPFLDIGFQCS